MDANSRGLHKFSVTVRGMAVTPQGEENSSSPRCSLHKLEWGFPSSALRYVSLSVLAGFYPVNHTDCLQSQLHHCFDGITGELAHAFFPPTGEIHFDDHEYWILGNMRFSWKKGEFLSCLEIFELKWWMPQTLLGCWRQAMASKATETKKNISSIFVAGVWLTDLVHVATHEIGHVLGLMHSMDPKAIMHLNATLTGRKLITQDEVWGMHRLYGMFSAYVSFLDSWRWSSLEVESWFGTYHYSS